MSLTCLVVYMFLAGIMFPPLFVYFNLEPGYYTIQEFLMWCGLGRLENLSSGWKYLISFIRLAGTNIGVMETSRSGSLFLITILGECHQCEVILVNFLTMKWNPKVLRAHRFIRFAMQDL